MLSFQLQKHTWTNATNEVTRLRTPMSFTSTSLQFNTMNKLKSWEHHFLVRMFALQLLSICCTGEAIAPQHCSTLL